MDQPKFIVSNQRGESISIQRVKIPIMTAAGDIFSHIFQSFNRCKGYLDYAKASPNLKFVAGGTYDDR